MKEKSKRLLSLLMVLAMTLSLFPGTALAVEEQGTIADTCICDAPCRAERVNEACPVCGAEGAALAACAAKAQDLQAPPDQEAPPARTVITGFLDMPAESAMELLPGEEPEVPDALYANVEGAEESAQVPVIWTSAPEFQKDVEGKYVFTSALAAPDAYTLADGAAMPQVTVTVKAEEDEMGKPLASNNVGPFNETQLGEYFSGQTNTYNEATGVFTFPNLNGVICTSQNGTEHTLSGTMDVYLCQGMDESNHPIALVGTKLPSNRSISLYDLGKTENFTGLHATNIKINIAHGWSAYDPQKPVELWTASYMSSDNWCATCKIQKNGANFSLGDRNSWTNPNATPVSFSISGSGITVTPEPQSIRPSVDDHYNIKTVTLTAKTGYKLPASKPANWPATLTYTRNSDSSATVTGYFVEAKAQALTINGETLDIYVSSKGFDTEGTGANQGDGSNAHPYATLTKAYEQAQSGATIHVMDELTLTAGVTFDTASKNVTITGDSNVRILRGTSLTAEPLIKVTNGTITLKNIVLDGQGGQGTLGGEVTAASPLAEASGTGVLALKDGAVLQNNNSIAGVGGVYLGGTRGSLLLSGGTIQYCKATGTRSGVNASASAVLVDGAYFSMTGGSIQYNSGEVQGALTIRKVYAGTPNRVCTMSGGTIQHNVTTATSGAGGVYLSGAVTVATGGSGTQDSIAHLGISGGSITNNTGTGAGGIAFGDSSAKLYLDGGAPIIKDNRDSSDAVKNVFYNKALSYSNINPVLISSALQKDSWIGVYADMTNETEPVSFAYSASTTGGDADAIAANSVAAFHSDKASEAGVRVGDPYHGQGLQSEYANYLYFDVAARQVDELYVNANYTGGEGNGTYAKPYTTLQAAYDAATARTQKPIEIRLLSDVTLDAAVTFGTKLNGDALKNLIVTSYTGENTEASGAGWSIKRGSSLTDASCLTVKAYDKIEFRHVSLDGADLAATTPFLTVSSGGKATLGKGVTAVNHQITGSAVYLFSVLGSGSILTLDGAEISGNTVTGTNDLISPSAVLGAGSTGNLTIKGSTDVHGNTVSDSASVVTIGLYEKPVFHMEGGKIRDNTLNGIAPAAVYMRGAATEAHLYFSGSPLVYDNVTASGEQKNVYLKNSEADAYLELTGALTGGKVGVYAETMPSASKKTVPVAIGSGEYAATATDAGYFKSDKETTAGISFADSTHTVVLDYDARSATGGVDKNGGGYVEVTVSPNTSYAVLDKDGAAIPGLRAYDKDGNALTPTSNGWYATEKGPITFKPVQAGSNPMVVSIPTTGAENTPPTSKADSGTGVQIPAVSEKQLSAEIKDGEPKTVSLTVEPADSSLVYGLVDKDGAAVNAGAWQTVGTDGKVVFDGLSPNTGYKVVAKPATGDESSTADKAGAGVGVKTPAENFQDISAGAVSRDDGTSGKDKITLKPTSADQQYAVIDKATGEVVKGANGQPIWKTGAGETPLVFDGLESGKDYEVVTRTPGAPASLPGKGVDVPKTVVKGSDVGTGKAGGDGKSSITVGNTDANTKYAVVDQATGKVVSPIGTDADGWLTGTGGTLSFPGLAPGGSYKVVAVPKDAGKDKDGTTSGGNTPGSPYPTEPGNVAGPTVKIPAVSADQLTGGYVKGTSSPADDTATVTVDPSAQGVHYVVTDADGKIVAMKDGNGSKLTFDGLTPGTDYKVAVIPDGTKVPDGGTKRPIAVGDSINDAVKDDGTSVKDQINDAAVGIVTPVAPVPSDKITRGPDDNKQGNDSREDKITIGESDSGLEYAVVDKDTGKVVAPVGTASDTPDADGWQTGNGSGLSFNNLDPNKEYEVVVRKPGADGATGIPGPGTAVGKRGAMAAHGVVKDTAGNPVANAVVKATVATIDGGYITIEAKTNAKGEYTLKGSNVQTPAEYAVYVDGGSKGRETVLVTMSQSQPQDLGDITTDANTASIAGGAVGDYGKPLTNADVKIRNKATGELVATGGKPAGSTLNTTAGGGYVVEGLPDGTYIVETSGSGKSGMTEITVKNGAASPNKAGGYGNMDLAVTPGAILSGKVTDLGDGEKATVSLNIPVYDEKGNSIGSKTVTAQAVGPTGYYQIAGVPDGKYPVTVATPRGVVTGDATVTGGAVVQTDPSAGMTETGLKAENGGLNAAAPAVKPENPSAITGAVVDKDGKPVKGTDIAIYNEQGEKVGSATTGDGGGYTVPNDLPDGKYYISADQSGKNGLTGPVELKSGKTTGKTTVSLPTDDGKLLAGKVTTSGGAAASNATVVVKDKDGNVIATAKTNANGQYFVGSVPSGAAVSIVTPGGETADFTVSGVGSTTWDGSKQTAQPGSDALSIIGPDGSVLPVAQTESGKNAKISVKDAAGDKTGSFTVEAGVLKTKTDTPDGTYTVTVEKDGMLVEKQIVVSGGKITGGSPFQITSAPVTGTVRYDNGANPIDASISVDGWGSAKVNTNTGKYELPHMPDGTYTAKITVTDGNTTSTITVPLTVKNGQASYGTSVTGDVATGATVTPSGTNLTVGPTNTVKTAQSTIGAAKTAVADAKNHPNDAGKNAAAIKAVKNALDAIAALTEEGLRQIDANASRELSAALDTLLGESLNFSKPTAEGVQNHNAVVQAIQDQQAMLVSGKELDTANSDSTTVDVSLALKVTPGETSTVKKDLPQVDALATQVGATEKAVFEIVVEKTTEVKENNVQVSLKTTNLSTLPVPVEITLAIPADLQGFDYYSVVRVHDGTAQRIPSTATRTQVTFRSNLYSTYAILTSNDPIFEDDGTVNPVAPPPGGGGGGGGGGAGGGGSDTVSIISPKHGKVSVDKPSAPKGQTVTITATPDKGYRLGSLTVTDKKGGALQLRDLGNNKYSFVQPDSSALPVTIEAMFEKMSGAAPDYASCPKDDTCPIGPFADASPTAWYHDGVHYCVDGGLMHGVSDTAFNPNGTTTRGMIVTILYRLEGEPKTSGASYPDVAADQYCADAVAWGAANGIVTGYTNGNFGPNDPITREQMAAILYRYAAYKGYDVTARADLEAFSDSARISGYAAGPLAWANAEGLVTGKGGGILDPRGNATRAQAATILMRLCVNIAAK